MNTLYYGDNLSVLREHVDSQSVDLIYLDPPFNSNRSYNVLFKDESGIDSEAQITAFEDTWHWGPTAEFTYDELVTQAPDRVATAISALRQLIGTNQMMAYLVMMAARLVELHRVLKPTGSLYLHCDPTASHYLKVILDTIFGPENFVNEIVWKRASAHNDPKRHGRIHDTIFYYTRTRNYVWNIQYTAYSDEYLKSEWRRLPSGRLYKTENMLDPQNKMAEYDFMGTTARWRTDYEGMMELWNAPQTEVPNSHGRIKLGRDSKPIKRCRILFLDEMSGVPLQDWWDDIMSLRGGAKERLDYPTQKPLALLERIIASSSNPGDLVLDPFAGCGTAMAAAQKLGRRWIGIDITHLSVSLLKYRMKAMFDLESKQDYQVIGEPVDLAGAYDLATLNRYQFQWWALSLVEAQPLGGQEGSRQGKKGSDKGIDGVIPFVEVGGKRERVIVQVKSGHVSADHIRDLIGTVESEKAAMGVFITLKEPTGPMKSAALGAGFYESPLWGKKYPRIQILTIEELLAGQQVEMPPAFGAFKQAERIKDAGPEQGRLL